MRVQVAISVKFNRRNKVPNLMIKILKTLSLILDKVKKNRVKMRKNLNFPYKMVYFLQDHCAEKYVLLKNT